MIRLRQIKLNIDHDNQNDLLKKVAKKLQISENDIENIVISKRSIDARKKDNIVISYEVDIQVNDENKVLNSICNKDIFIAPNEVYTYHLSGTKSLKKSSCYCRIWTSRNDVCVYA